MGGVGCAGKISEKMGVDKYEMQEYTVSYIGHIGDIYESTR
jgi:hypothetical protein